MATSDTIRERVWKAFPFDKEKRQLRQLGVDMGCGKVGRHKEKHQDQKLKEKS